MEKNCDVIVIGAGPHGMNLAIWLIKENPECRITILESQKSFTHKIGESTLSGFCKAIRSNDIRHETFQNLFYTKKGLGYWHCDDHNDDLTVAPEYIIENFDETFQIERRVFDGLLEANCKRMGIEVIRGAHVDPKTSTLSAQGSNIVYSHKGEKRSIQAKVVVDATGPASIISSRHPEGGGYVPSDVPFQTSSVWAYYKNVKWLKDYENWAYHAEYPRDEYTQHLCFKEGWVWYIPIISWQKSKDENLERLLQYAADPENPVLDRDTLAQKFDCEYEQIWSIGIALRSDRDDVISKEGAKATFEKYLKKVPAFGKLMEGAELLSQHYKNHKPYGVRVNFRRHSAKIAGDGWLSVGDAAFFVDPLRSPGLLGGAATAYHAKIAILKALRENNFSKEIFTGYVNRIEELHEMMEDQGQISYLSHNHPRAIELARRFGEVSSRGHFEEFKHLEEYGFFDTNVWGHLYTKHFRMQKKFLNIMLEEEARVGALKPVEEQSSADYETMVQRLEELVGSHLAENESMNHYAVLNQN